ncbi:shikimate kinase [Anaerobacillus isosaccharinicus]|uniref:Shikimate kinase n=2 Tax=Anaerobacillus isosaccharinicus TaxID=1532552 RepID=A0A7S7RE71_9BACI|nr:shikimate kinase [Anaerobacillus isosaccharinicus]
MINQEHLFITGFMGAGKTTVGKLLSEQLKIPVIDTDLYIERIKNKKVSEIFQEDGEAKFRDLETESLQEICKQNQAIITTGGGIILREQNRQLMKQQGKVIFLYCDIEETTRRLAKDNSRPLFNADLEENKKRFEARLPLYREADYVIDTTSKTVEQIVEEIVSCLE